MQLFSSFKFDPFLTNKETNNNNSSLEIANVEMKDQYNSTEKNENDVSTINEDLADEETNIDFQNDIIKVKDEEVFHENKKTCIYNIDTDLTSSKTNIVSVMNEIMEEDVSYEKKNTDVPNIKEDLMY